MGLYKEDVKYNDDFGMEVVHCVRQVLSAMGVYHAPWVIIAEKVNAKAMRIECYWNPKNTFPSGQVVDLEPTHFIQNTEVPIKNLCDLNLCALARALAKRMNRRITPRK